MAQSILEQAISKYGGTDDAYKNKLKSTIRDAMGYSNYMSKLKRETSSPAPIGDISGLSPAGITNRIGSRFGMQNQRINTLGNIAGAIDTAAGSIASKLAAKNKAADQYRYDSSFVFQPKDPLDQRLLDYSQNPYNEDGSVKSLQQMEAELNETLGQQEGYSPEDIKARIVERLPADYIGNEMKYAYRFRGMTEKQASEEMIIDYGYLILMGKGDKVPKELYPYVYASLSDAEKSALARMKFAPESAAATSYRNKFLPKDEADEFLESFNQ